LNHIKPKKRGIARTQGMFAVRIIQAYALIKLSMPQGCQIGILLLHY